LIDDEELKMNKWIQWIGLKQEAILLDSWLYILKSMVAISIGYLCARAIPITQLDTISVLLGVMYNLEPTNISGLRSGFNQMLASSLGAITTGFLVYLMGYNVNAITIAVGMGFTLFIALKIDYRMVSPVAIFTSIYMHQLIQKDPLGNPSIWLTFRLRIMALGLGIAIAIISNFVFSFIYYRKIGKKRLEFAKIQSVLGLMKSKNILTNETHLESDINNIVFAHLFTDIEMVKTNIEAMLKERYLPFNQKEHKNLRLIHSMISSIKVMMHLAYDSNYIKEDKQVSVPLEIINHIDQIIACFQSIDFTKGIHNPTIHCIEFESLGDFSDEYNPLDRIRQNTVLMGSEFNKILTLYAQLK